MRYMSGNVELGWNWQWTWLDLALDLAVELQISIAQVVQIIGYLRFFIESVSENAARIWIDIMEHRQVIRKGLHLSVILRRFSERIEEYTDKKSVRWVVYLCIYDFFSEKLL